MTCIRKYIFLWILNTMFNVIISQPADRVVIATSNDLVAVSGANVSLKWNVSVPDSQIKWCYWQVKPNGENWIRLLGWDNISKKRIKMSEKGQKIRFAASEPCTGDITIPNVNKDDEGHYQFSVIEKSNDKQHISLRGTQLTLNERDLVYKINIGETRYIIHNDISTDDSVQPVNIIQEDDVKISASAKGILATFLITVNTDNNKEEIGECQVCRQFEMEVKMKQKEDNTSVVVQIIPDIIGIKPLVLRQPVIVMHPKVFTYVALCCTVAVLICVILGICIVYLFRHKRILKKWCAVNESNTTLNEKEQENELLNEKLDDVKQALMEENRFLKKKLDDVKNVLDDKEKEIKCLMETLDEVNKVDPGSPVSGLNVNDPGSPVSGFNVNDPGSPVSGLNVNDPGSPVSGLNVNVNKFLKKKLDEVKNVVTAFLPHPHFREIDETQESYIS